MKNAVIVAFLLSLNSSIANAQAFQANKPVICDETKKIIKSLTEAFNEKPTWIANDSTSDSRYALFVNEKTGTWTLLQVTPEISCILGVGTESKFHLGTTT
jgi:hypothetical protein